MRKLYRISTRGGYEYYVVATHSTAAVEAVISIHPEEYIDRIEIICDEVIGQRIESRASEERLIIAS